MASTALSTFSTADNILNFDDSSFIFEPDPTFLSTTSALGLLGAFSPSLADLVADFADSIDEISGQILVTGGVFDTNLTLADGSTLLGTFDAPATLTELAALAATTNGTVTLAGGILNTTLTSGEESLTLEGVDLATLVSTYLLDTLKAIDTTVPFANGAFSFEVGSLLGPISGTIDLGGGDFNLDLTTPFGLFSADIDFGDDALVPFTTPVPIIGKLDGVVDFNAGNIVAGLGPFGAVAVPISSLSGTLSLTDGIAKVKADVPLVSGLPFVGNTTVPVMAEIEIGPMASEYVAKFIQDLTVAGTITDGVLNATLDSPFGLFETTFDLVAFTNQGANFFAGIDGVIDIGSVLLTADLTTPLGEVNNTFNLVDIAGLLDVPLAGII
jgi:hypothetical protein